MSEDRSEPLSVSWLNVTCSHTIMLIANTVLSSLSLFDTVVVMESLSITADTIKVIEAFCQGHTLS